MSKGFGEDQERLMNAAVTAWLSSVAYTTGYPVVCLKRTLIKVRPRRVRWYVVISLN